MLIYYFFGTGTDFLRALIGPLPSYICLSNVFVKNFVHCNILLAVLAITSARFMFVCIYKSFPTMDDDFFANLLFRCINLISFILVFIRVNSPGKFPLNYVSPWIVWFSNNCSYLSIWTRLLPRLWHLEFANFRWFAQVLFMMNG